MVILISLESIREKPFAALFKDILSIVLNILKLTNSLLLTKLNH